MTTMRIAGGRILAGALLGSAWPASANGLEGSHSGSVTGGGDHVTVRSCCHVSIDQDGLSGLKMLKRIAALTAAVTGASPASAGLRETPA